MFTFCEKLDDINRSNRDGRLSLERGGDDPFGVGLDRKTRRSAGSHLEERVEAHDDGMRAKSGEGEREFNAPRAEWLSFPAKVYVGVRQCGESYPGAYGFRAQHALNMYAQSRCTSSDVPCGKDAS